LVVVVLRALGAAALAVVVVDFELVEDRAAVAPVVVVVEAVDAADVSVLADAADVAVGEPAASHPVITIMPVAPVAPVIRRARRAGCGRRRVRLMGVIIEPRSQNKLGAR
jgi:hypothetical protein